jgi:predicted GNAT family N-acyltransferase
MTGALSVRPVSCSADRDAAYAVRRRVFQDEQGVPAEIEFDADDDTAIHLVAQADGVIIGTGRVVLHPDYAKIGRMAVLPQWRRHGIGRALLEALLREAAQRGAPHAVLHAQVHAVGFYARAGFVVVGDEFEEAGIPHRRMERTLR